MVVVIFVLAFLSLGLGLAAAVAALNLVPTDLGFAFAQIAAVLLAAGFIVAAIGLATSTLKKTLLALRNVSVEPISAEPTSAPVASQHDAQEAVLPPSQTETAPLGKAAVIGVAAGAGALVAGGAAALAHSGGMAEKTAPLPPLDAVEAALERDLFETLPKVEPQPALAVEPLVETQPEPVVTAAHPEPLDETEAPAAHTSPLAKSPFAKSSLLWKTAFGGKTGRSTDTSQTPIEDVSPTTAAPAEMQATLLEPEAEPEIAAPHMAEPGIVEPAPVAAEAEPVVIADEPAAVEAQLEPASISPPAPQPGLIADADLAALHSEEHLPPLAPIHTLEIVGAYDSAGTRFTMYSDGSVIAAGAEGERRFRTLDELRRHLGHQS